jgi:hypothetical protein
MGLGLDGKDGRPLNILRASGCSSPYVFTQDCGLAGVYVVSLRSLYVAFSATADGKTVKIFGPAGVPGGSIQARVPPGSKLTLQEVHRIGLEQTLSQLRSMGAFGSAVEIKRIDIVEATEFVVGTIIEFDRPVYSTLTSLLPRETFKYVR